MVDEQLARETIGSLGTAAAMLIEDAHLGLVMLPADAEAASALATALERLVNDLRALGAAAMVLTHYDP